MFKPKHANRSAVYSPVNLTVSGEAEVASFALGLRRLKAEEAEDAVKEQVAEIEGIQESTRNSNP
jgi:hypothetical protein